MRRITRTPHVLALLDLSGARSARGREVLLGINLTIPMFLSDTAWTVRVLKADASEEDVLSLMTPTRLDPPETRRIVVVDTKGSVFRFSTLAERCIREAGATRIIGPVTDAELDAWDSVVRPALEKTNDHVAFRDALLVVPEMETEDYCRSLRKEGERMRMVRMGAKVDWIIQLALSSIVDYYASAPFGAIGVVVEDGSGGGALRDEMLEAMGTYEWGSSTFVYNFDPSSNASINSLLDRVDMNNDAVTAWIVITNSDALVGIVEKCVGAWGTERVTSLYGLYDEDVLALARGLGAEAMSKMYFLSTVGPHDSAPTTRFSELTDFHAIAQDVMGTNASSVAVLASDALRIALQYDQALGWDAFLAKLESLAFLSGDVQLDAVGDRERGTMAVGRVMEFFTTTVWREETIARGYGGKIAVSTPTGVIQDIDLDPVEIGHNGYDPSTGERVLVVHTNCLGAATTHILFDETGHIEIVMSSVQKLEFFPYACKAVQLGNRMPSLRYDPGMLRMQYLPLLRSWAFPAAFADEMKGALFIPVLATLALYGDETLRADITDSFNKVMTNDPAGEFIELGRHVSSATILVPNTFTHPSLYAAEYRSIIGSYRESPLHLGGDSIFLMMNTQAMLENAEYDQAKAASEFLHSITNICAGFKKLRVLRVIVDSTATIFFSSDVRKFFDKMCIVFQERFHITFLAPPDRIPASSARELSNAHIHSNPFATMERVLEAELLPDSRVLSRMAFGVLGRFVPDRTRSFLKDRMQFKGRRMCAFYDAMSICESALRAGVTEAPILRSTDDSFGSTLYDIHGSLASSEIDWPEYHKSMFPTTGDAARVMRDSIDVITSSFRRWIAETGGEWGPMVDVMYRAEDMEVGMWKSLASAKLHLSVGEISHVEAWMQLAGTKDLALLSEPLYYCVGGFGGATSLKYLHTKDGLLQEKLADVWEGGEFFVGVEIDNRRPLTIGAYTVMEDLFFAMELGMDSSMEEFVARLMTGFQEQAKFALEHDPALMASFLPIMRIAMVLPEDAALSPIVNWTNDTRRNLLYSLFTLDHLDGDMDLTTMISDLADANEFMFQAAIPHVEETPDPDVVYVVLPDVGTGSSEWTAKNADFLEKLQSTTFWVPTSEVCNPTSASEHSMKAELLITEYLNIGNLGTFAYDFMHQLSMRGLGSPPNAYTTRKVVLIGEGVGAALAQILLHAMRVVDEETSDIHRFYHGGAQIEIAGVVFVHGWMLKGESGKVPMRYGGEAFSESLVRLDTQVQALFHSWNMRSYAGFAESAYGGEGTPERIIASTQLMFMLSSTEMEESDMTTMFAWWPEGVPVMVVVAGEDEATLPKDTQTEIYDALRVRFPAEDHHMNVRKVEVKKVSTWAQEMSEKLTMDVRSSDFEHLMDCGDDAEGYGYWANWNHRMFPGMHALPAASVMNIMFFMHTRDVTVVGGVMTSTPKTLPYTGEEALVVAPPSPSAVDVDVSLLGGLDSHVKGIMLTYNWIALSMFVRYAGPTLNVVADQEMLLELMDA